MGQCSTSIKAYDFKKINSEISSLKKRVCYLESNSGGSSSKFGVAGEDSTATQNRAFTLGNFKFSLLDNNGNTNLLLDPINDINFFGFDTAGDKVLITGWSFDEANIIEGRAAAKVGIRIVESINGFEAYFGDVDNGVNGTKIFIDDNHQSVEITNVQTGAITDDFATFDGDQIKKIPAPVESGTYTPTVGTLVNCSNVNPSPFQYLRVGNVVTVSGIITADATAVGTVNIDINVPINSDLNNSYECAGAICADAGPTKAAGFIYANVGVNEVQIEFISTGALTYTIVIHFTYQITVTPP